MKIIKKIFLVILLPLVIVSLFSCDVYNLKKDNSKNKELTYETTYDKSNASINGFVSVNKKMNIASELVTGESIVCSSDRKISKSVSLNAETKTFDDAIEWIKKYVSSFNGIIDNSYIDTGDKSTSNYKKNANFSIRVPANKLDGFLGKIGNNLNIKFKQENIIDITDDYYDSETKLKNLKIEEDNLNEMLKLAKNVDEIIKIEDKLSEVRTNIENISRRIKNYDKQINYSKVDLSITEVKDLTEINSDKNNFSKESLNKKLLKTFNDVILFLKNVAAYIFINIPWIILGIIVIIFVILLYMILIAIFVKKKDKVLDDKELKENKPIENIKNDNKSNNDKKELSDDEKFDKVLDELGKVITDESMNVKKENGEVEVEFFNEDK